MSAPQVGSKYEEARSDDYRFSELTKIIALATVRTKTAHVVNSLASASSKSAFVRDLNFLLLDYESLLKQKRGVGARLARTVDPRKLEDEIKMLEGLDDATFLDEKNEIIARSIVLAARLLRGGRFFVAMRLLECIEKEFTEKFSVDTVLEAIRSMPATLVTLCNLSADELASLDEKIISRAMERFQQRKKQG